MSRPAADCADEVRDAFCRSVGAVGGPEGVVDVDVTERSELLGEVLVVGLLFGVEAEVFEQQGLARLEVGGELKRDRADAVGGEGDVLVGVHDVVEQRAQARGDGSQAHRGYFGSLGAAEVRGEDHLCLTAQRVLDGGDGLADARVVGDRAVFERHVEVDADEHTFAGEIEVADRKLGH